MSFHTCVPTLKTGGFWLLMLLSWHHGWGYRTRWEDEGRREDTEEEVRSRNVCRSRKYFAIKLLLLLCCISSELILSVQVLNLFLALLLNAFASDSIDKHRETSAEKSKLMDGIYRLKHLLCCCFPFCKKNMSHLPDDLSDTGEDLDMAPRQEIGYNFHFILLLSSSLSLQLLYCNTIW